jgi:hypothetical protein
MIGRNQDTGDEYERKDTIRRHGRPNGCGRDLDFAERRLRGTTLLFFTVTMAQPALLAITLLAGIVTGFILAGSLSGKWQRPTSKPPAE